MNRRMGTSIVGFFHEPSQKNWYSLFLGESYFLEGWGWEHGKCVSYSKPEKNDIVLWFFRDVWDMFMTFNDCADWLNYDFSWDLLGFNGGWWFFHYDLTTQKMLVSWDVLGQNLGFFGDCGWVATGEIPVWFLQEQIGSKTTMNFLKF